VFRSFAAKLTILTAALALIIAVMNYLSPFLQSFQNFTWFSLLFFFLVTLITGYIGFRSFEKTAHGFVSSVNGMMMIKLFLCIIFIIAYVVIAKPKTVVFISSFFFLYLIYTVFEIRELILAQKMLQKQKQDGNL
jgi:hypothetical protein